VIGPVVGVLLAGGLARRMGGGDKSLVELGGRSLMAHAIERLRPQVGAMVISANGPPARFARFGLPVVADPVPGQPGPLAGMLAGLVWARANRPGATHIATVATDTPFFPLDLVARLQEAAGDGAAVATSDGRVHSVFGLFPVRAEAALAKFVAGGGSLAVRDWLVRIGAVEVAFPPGADRRDPFFNINTPADLEEAARCL
jgi:molybdopterin-guanine dinucleotide biosynthesis protein A